MGDKNKKSFIFYASWKEVLKEYPAEVRLEVYDAIIEYVASGTLSELKPMARIAFSFIKKEIDYNEQRYQDVVNKRSEAGKRSAESRNNNKSTNSTNLCIPRIMDVTSLNVGDLCSSKLISVCFISRLQNNSLIRLVEANNISLCSCSSLLSPPE
jgi:hypothetical protein